MGLKEEYKLSIKAVMFDLEVFIIGGKHFDTKYCGS